MKKILVIQHKMIGDVLASTILFEALRKNYPGAELHYLINQHTVAVLENNPFIDKLHLFTPEMQKSKRAFYSFLQEVRKEKYDVVIDVYSKLNSALIAFFSGAKIRIGIKKWYLRFAYSHTPENLKKQTQNIPLAYENRLRMLLPLNLNIDYSVTPKIYLREQEKEEMLKKCAENGVSFQQHDYIMISLLGSDASKTYPLHYMAELLNSTAAEFPNIRFLLNYIPKQRKEVDELLSQCTEQTRNHIDDFYTSKLRDFIVLTSFCKAVMGNEGGAVNMAKALGIPTFAIFSPWVTTESWGASSKEKMHQTVHLKDYKPDLYKLYKKKVFKKDYKKYYDSFFPNLFEKNLIAFIKSL